MGLGVSDAADVVSSADYLKTLDYVDADRIGVWGLSYGGYLTLQALTRDPLVFRCGINVAGVVDWATYGAGYTTPRLGTPVENPEIYRVSAPIYHVEKLARPLLVLHGTNDRNVAFRDSLRLWDQLLKLGKDFDMACLPGRNPFLPPRAHSPGRVATRGGVFRSAFKARRQRPRLRGNTEATMTAIVSACWIGNPVDRAVRAGGRRAADRAPLPVPFVMRKAAFCQVSP